MADDPPGTIDVTIRIDTAEADRLDDIVSALEASGLTRLDVHRRFLIVNGCIEPGSMDALRHVAGVVSVRADRGYKAQD